ncbi:uncharacterized protein LOC114528519 [Dendronephthya gigantea]|uniref:uncharacterized protein LOC114528519 n=1 Tax=Dendronephthya gigantea TaxID=151771 RepID=UPI00106DC780|nr:uncharacterized protein LOC114528519 [Dendronephthya gigantea]
MAEGGFAGETRGLSRSLEKMCMNTPVGKKASKRNADLENYSSAPLSPPQTVDIKQKRERSESLMLCQTNHLLATKRRLRSRSRLGLGPEEIPSAFMSPPCSNKPRERTHSRSQSQNERLFGYPEDFAKHLPFNVEASSVYMTPCTQPRKPLQSKDMNTLKESENFSINEGRLSANIDYPSDESSDEDTCSGLEDNTRLKLNFDQCASDGKMEGNQGSTPYPFKIIGRRMMEKKTDFIKELVNMNCEEICKQIFSYLEPRDLQRVASVSKLWRKICKKDRIASPRLDQFISGRMQHVMRKGKENLGHHTKFDYSVPQRTPFSVKDHNTIWTPEDKQSTAGIGAVKTNIMSTFERMKCPMCGSPSRKTDNNTCECAECQEIFCALCQKKVDKNHKTGKCQMKINNVKKRKQAIGSKKSKDRLKRF